MRVIIVEDEAILRQGLVRTLPWSEMGCEIVGEAGNGLEGLALLRELQPDAVITDIKMPQLDGLAMLRAARDEGCTAAAVILTSYAEFSYAQEAMRLGSVDYLLKPVEEKELAAVLAKIRPGKKAGASTAGDSLADWPALLTAARRQNSYVSRAVSEILAHYSEHISIEDLAEHAGLSASYLSRKFKEVTGHTFGELLAARRIEAALQLLQGDYRIYEIAEKVGFHDYKNFCLVFKKYMQRTPKEYVREQGRR